MNKSMRIFWVVVLLAAFNGVNAQSISHYFIQMPSNVIPTITVDTRKDLVDFFKNGKLASMRSALGGDVILKEMSEDFLLLQTSENADIQFKLLQLNDTTRIIAVIRSVFAPLKDSRIQFYSTLWKPLVGFDLPKLSFLDFIDVEKAKQLNLSDRLNQISLRNFVAFKFDQKTPQVVAHSALRADIRTEILKEFEPVIKDSLLFIWNKDRFDPQSFKK